MKTNPDAIRDTWFVVFWSLSKSVDEAGAQFGMTPAAAQRKAQSLRETRPSTRRMLKDKPRAKGREAQAWRHFRKHVRLLKS